MEYEYITDNRHTNTNHFSSLFPTIVGERLRSDFDNNPITIYETPYESLDFSPVFWDNGL